MIKDKFEIMPLPHPVGKKYYAYIWDKKLPHGHFFSQFIRKIKETGILEKFKIKYLVSPRSDCAKSDQFFSMGLFDIISAFAMLMVAFIFGTMMSLTENLVGKKNTAHLKIVQSKTINSKICPLNA